MPRSIDNVGSAARDFCMLERNLLALLKLALLLSLLSSSVLLRARLPEPSDQDDTTHNQSKAGLPMATIQMVASLAAIGAAYWEYTSNLRALRNMRAFLVATNPYLAILSLVAGVVITTCIALLADEHEL